MYHFFALHNIRKSFQTSTIRLNRKCLKVIGTSSDIFGIIEKSSENHRKSSEVARTFSEIPVKTRQKSHAFDSEKVGRYTFGSPFLNCLFLCSAGVTEQGLSGVDGGVWQWNRSLYMPYNTSGTDHLSSRLQ